MYISINHPITYIPIITIVIVIIIIRILLGKKSVNNTSVNNTHKVDNLSDLKNQDISSITIKIRSYGVPVSAYAIGFDILIAIGVIYLITQHLSIFWCIIGGLCLSLPAHLLAYSLSFKSISIDNEKLTIQHKFFQDKMVHIADILSIYTDFKANAASAANVVLVIKEKDEHITTIDALDYHKKDFAQLIRRVVSLNPSITVDQFVEKNYLGS